MENKKEKLTQVQPLPVKGKKIHIPLKGRAVEAPTLEEKAAEYLKLKKRMESTSAKLRELGDEISSQIAALPDKFIQVKKDRLAYITTERPSFDLPKAKSDGLGRKLKPYIMVTETLDLKAAQKQVPAEELAPYISVKTSSYLKVMPLKKKK